MLLAGAVWATVTFGPSLFGAEKRDGDLYGQLDGSAEGWRASEALAEEGDGAINQLKIALHSDEHGMGAARALGLMGGPGVKVLMNALTAPHDERLRIRAATGLVWAGNRAHLQWERFWREATADELERASLAFDGGLSIEIPTKTSTDLEQHSWERDLAVRAWATASAAHTGLQRVRPKPRVCAAIVVREASVYAAKHPDDLPQFMRFVDALSDKHERVRVELTRALGNLGRLADPAVPALLKMVESDESTWVRACAVTALGSIGLKSEEVVAAIVKALDHTDLEVRSRAAEALGALKLDDPEIVKTLMEIAREGTGDRIAAVKALGVIGRPSHPALEDLYAIAKNDSLPASLRLAAAGSVVSIGGRTDALVPFLSEMEKEGSRFEHREEATRILRRIKTGA